MKTIAYIDFLGPLPLGKGIRMGSAPEAKENFPVDFYGSPVARTISDDLFEFERADVPCYLIMGLAIVIAVLVPLLNWH